MLVAVGALCVLALNIFGCASVPPKEQFTTYKIGGVVYYPLVALCRARGVNWRYDTFTRTMFLEGGGHKLSCMAGDKLALADGRAAILNYPVELYQGTIVVPEQFKEQVFERLFGKATPAREKTFLSAKIKKVVVDAGHGGFDPGTIGRTTGVREKDINLDIARRLSKLLRDDGVEVVMTRNSDKFVPLPRRVEIANGCGADLFISIHSNANRVRSLDGFEVYYVSPSVNDAKRAMAAAKGGRLSLENAAFAGNSLNLKAILWDMIYTQNRGQSIALSRALCRAMDSNLEAKIRGVKGARFQVLRGAKMPAVLIEVGFLSNGSEERKLKNSFYREKIAQAIEEGVIEYSKGAQLITEAKGK